MPQFEMTQSSIVRTEVVAKNGMVTAKHPVVAEIGIAILQRGGNAIDAAVAMAFAINTIEPRMTGIGGGGFMTIALANGENYVVDFFPCAPSGATPDLYELTPEFKADKLGFTGVKDNANAVGHRAVGIPGAVAGALLALEHWGTLPRAEIIAPAIRLARDGIAVTFHDTLSSAIGMGILKRNAEASRLFLNNGMPFVPMGDKPLYFRNPDLANTLEKISVEGARAFYQGDLAQKIVAELQSGGYGISLDDLANYRALVKEPLKTDYRGLELLLLPGATGGPTIAEIAHMLEPWNLKELGHASAAYVHRLIEACKLSLADRMAFLADEQANEPSTISRALASREFAAERCKVIGDQALGTYEPIKPGATGYQPSAESCTTFLSAWDNHGNVVALTQTVNGSYGSGVAVPGTGILLNNAMVLFDPRPGQPNSIAPGKRPLSSMAHVIVRRDGKPIALAGAPGGRKIIDTVTQVMLNLIDFGMGPQAACGSPFIDPAGQTVLIDRAFGAQVIAELVARGHQLDAQETTIWPRLSGNPAAITFDGTEFRGGVDLFTTGVAAGF
ncbi:MAG: gamma-glutamyltransferase [Chloroflexi bacterium]|nr:gamma-glutamyltransferase [Chloroflexota bacterium]